jgi:hypothetical protein
MLVRRIGDWAVRDFRTWPRVHQRVRIGFLVGGIAVLTLGWVAASVMGVPADMPDTGIQWNPGWFLWFFVGLGVLCFFCSGPIVLYVRYVQTLFASVVTGAALVFVIAWTFAFMVTSDSSTAGVALLYPTFLSYGITALGMVLDWPLRPLAKVWARKHM